MHGTKKGRHVSPLHRRSYVGYITNYCASMVTMIVKIVLLGLVMVTTA